MNISELQTPSLIVDQHRLLKNIERMKVRSNELGCRIRPHVKTAKSIDVIRGVGKGCSITVSTVAEAIYFASHGFSDLTYAVGISLCKLTEIAKLQSQGCTVNLLVDSVQMAKGLINTGQKMNVKFCVLIEIDCGAHRGGVNPNASELLEIANILRNCPNTIFRGLLTHAGHAYACSSIEEIEEIAEVERASVVGAACRLKSIGVECEIVSVGSTPTALFARSLDGVTEFRPGVFVFFDLYQHYLGCCELKDLALSVVATVIGRRIDLGYALIDAGALALSQDTCTKRYQGGDSYGAVFDAHGDNQLGDLVVSEVHQEHGFIRSLGNPKNCLLPEIGDKVRIFPNHACMMAAAFSEYTVVNSQGEVLDVWDKESGR